MIEIYTIGYAPFSADELVGLIKRLGIGCLIDIRSVPYSRYFAEYNQNVLEGKLKENKILYRNYAREFGARQRDRRFFAPEGYLDFEKYTQSRPFGEGVLKIQKGLAAGWTFVLMCAENDPIRCHRGIMVGRGLRERGFAVRHILSGGSLETQEHLEQRLLDLYFPNRRQTSLFFSDEKSLLNEAYREQNRKIAYRTEDE